MRYGRLKVQGESRKAGRRCFLCLEECGVTTTGNVRPVLHRVDA